MAIPKSKDNEVETNSQSADSQDVSPLMAELLAWSTDLPFWKRDALRRLVVQGSVSDREIDALTLACLADADAIGYDEDAPELEPLEWKHLPKTTVDSANVAIQAIGNIENANALADRQELLFSPVGLSVVYGDNASGKSGYARILKRAGRSRGRNEAIRSNVYEEEPGKPASATVHFLVGESARSIKWTDGEKPEELASVSCFDSECATFHVNEQNTIDFTPFGLHLFSELVNVCKRVKERIAIRAAAINRPASSLVENPVCGEETKVGKAIRGLSAKSKLATLAEISHIEKSDLDRAHRIEAILKEDPAIEAKSIQQQIKRIENLLTNVQRVEQQLGGDSIRRLRELAQDASSKREAAQISAKQLSGIPLDGVGTSPWAELWKAARRYSEVAYPGESFPVTGEDAACVLCHQALSDDAAARLQSFDAFVKDEAEAAAKQSEKAFENAISSVKQLDLLLGNWAPLWADLFDSDPNLEEALSLEIKNAASLQADLLKRPELLKDNLLGLKNETRKKVEAYRDKLVQQQQQLLASVNAEQTASLRLELQEIRDRQWLNDHLEEFLNEIDRLTKLNEYKKAERLTNHKAITDKGGKLAEKYVTEELTSRFSNEVRRLCGRDVNISIAKGRSTNGVPTYQLKLESQQKVKPGWVLSEGEFRCIAIAGFLSELATSDNRSAIILDDPVSSLGHQWRSQIARRLVEVSAERQVIVFTHDMFFVEELKRFADSAETVIHTNHIARSATTVGLCKPDLPWFGASTRQRLAVLRERLAELQDEYESASWEQQIEIAENVHGDLRETIERCVEREFVAGCVKRFENYIPVSKLWKASVFDDADADALHDLFRKCSANINGHDQSTSGRVSSPQYSDMVALVDQLEAVIDTVDNKREQLKRKRQRNNAHRPQQPFKPNF